MQVANWEFLSEALQDATRRQPALKLWFSATAKNTFQPGARRGETSLAELSTENAFQLAGMLVGDSSEGRSVGRASRNVAAESGFNPQPADWWRPACARGENCGRGR